MSVIEMKPLRLGFDILHVVKLLLIGALDLLFFGPILLNCNHRIALKENEGAGYVSG